MCTSRGKLAKLNYMDIKQLLDRKVIQNKRHLNQQGDKPPGSGDLQPPTGGQNTTGHSGDGDKSNAETNTVP